MNSVRWNRQTASGLRLQSSEAILTIALVVWLILPTAARADVGKAYVCPLLNQAPELDGEVAEDPAWRDVPAATGFHDVGSTGPSTRQTSFRIGYTPEALYLGVVCEEPTPESIQAVMSDGDPLWNEDSVEVFLSPDRASELQFIVNALGCRASPRTLRRWEAARRSRALRRQPH